MKIEAEKITNAALLRLACEATMHGQQSKVSLARMYNLFSTPSFLGG